MKANLCPPTFRLRSSHQRVSIMLLVDGVCTLADVVIPNPTRINLVLWVVLPCGVAMTIATRAKDGLYHD